MLLKIAVKIIINRHNYSVHELHVHCQLNLIPPPRDKMGRGVYFLVLRDGRPCNHVIHEIQSCSLRGLQPQLSAHTLTTITSTDASQCGGVGNRAQSRMKPAGTADIISMLHNDRLYDEIITACNNIMSFTPVRPSLITDRNQPVLTLHSVISRKTFFLPARQHCKLCKRWYCYNRYVHLSVVCHTLVLYQNQQSVMISPSTESPKKIKRGHPGFPWIWSPLQKFE